MAQSGSEADDALTGKQLRQLSNAIGEGEADAGRADLHEKVLDTLDAEGIQKIDLDLGGGEVDVLTETLRLYGVLNDVSGRVRAVMAEERATERVIAEDLPTELLGGNHKVREQIEDAKRRRDEHIPPQRWP